MLPPRATRTPLAVAKSVAKARTAFVCNECGADFNKWQGQCSACGAWDSISEIVLESAAAASSPASRRSSWAGKVDAPKVMALKERKARLFTAVLDDDRMFSAALTAEDIRGLLTD